ncbi:MAG: prenyltransferase [Planctomycetota bacterium]|nr:MAG: prenyltransferase [Planctomycetota bacterium]
MILAPLALLLPQADASVLSPEGRAAAERGLAYLAAAQAPDGSWAGDVGYKTEDNYRAWNTGKAHLGVTALAGMAFLAGGHVPGRGEYGEVVEKAVDFVVAQVGPNGYIHANETRMYSHAFATLFLAEAYGMSDNEELRPALRKAVDLIVDSQNRDGGWRYTPHTEDADMSVSACQVMALRAARNVGLLVPRSTIDRAVKYVRDSAVHEGDRLPRMPIGGTPPLPGAFFYQPPHATGNEGSRVTWPLTAAGVTILFHAGVHADRDIEAGLDYLERYLDRVDELWGLRNRGHYYFWYGHYYAVQAFHMAGGDRYRNYFHELERTLLRMQAADGSWPNQVGPGRNYGTATACLLLQIPREYLPIFER